MKAVLLILSALLAAPAAAHQQSLSYSSWQAQEDGLRAVLRHRAVDLSRARLHPHEADYLERTSAWLSGRLQVWRAGVPCAPPRASSRQLVDGWVATELRWRCPSRGTWTLRVDALFDLAPNHSQLARWRDIDGHIASQVLTENRRSWELADRARADGLGRFLLLGIEHILGGWDHLAFLLALLLLVRRGRDLLWLVTGFTLAHSLTLVATSLRVTAVHAPIVEAVIALSILLLCLENAWQLRRDRLPALLAAGLLGVLLLSPRMPLTASLGLGLFGLCYALLLRRQTAGDLRLRLALCFGFGLVHGFGFAGVLLDMQIPPEHRLMALLGFNLGVELGQLACVLPAWWLLRQLREPARATLVPAANATAAGLASYWLVLRLFA